MNYPTYKQLNSVAVDLTPILPGGGNGGAKIFVLELLRRLANMVPKTQFILLTQAASHDELASLDRPNMRRLMVVGASNRPHASRFERFAYRLLSPLSKQLRMKADVLGSSSQLLCALQVDLLYCPFTAPTYFEIGIPTVCTIYDLQHKTYPQFFDTAEVAHRDQIFASACRRATALTAISDYSRHAVLAHSNFEPARVRTIPLRMAQRLSPRVVQDKGLLALYGLTAQRYLIYPANFWKHKNHEMLLTAFGMACHGGLAADIKLVCTGAPDARQAWLSRAANIMNLGDRILFPGYLPNTELAVLVSNCAGMIFPSLYEGFGLPVIEAMAAGVPVACSNTASLPEVTADAAILFDPRIPTQIAQAMISLVDNQTLRIQLINAGRLRAAEFCDSERMATEYLQLFRYAMDNFKIQDLLSGADPDGWAGSFLALQYLPATDPQSLEMALFAPDWLPQPHVTLQASRGGKKCCAPFTLQRGQKAVFSLPLDSSGGCYEIRISPTFVPAKSMGGDDHRELSVNLESCAIVRANGQRVELFPERVSK